MNTDGATGSVAPVVDSRSRLVEAAVEMVFEHHAADIGIREVYEYLTPRLVADRAGVSRALIYHHWGTGDDDEVGAVDRFLEEVAASICSRTAGAPDVADAADLLPDTLSDVVLAFCQYEVDRMNGDGRAAIQVAQSMTLTGTWPPGEAELIRDRGVALYEQLAEKLGREAVAPLEIADVANAMSAVIEGFALMSRLLPDEYARDYDWQPAEGPAELVEGPWNLLGIVAESVVLNTTRPIRPNP